MAKNMRSTKVMGFSEAVDDALRQAMAEDERIIIIGEDVHALRAGLYVRFGADRVRPAPISEAAFLGAAGIADELNYVKVDKHTLQSTEYPNIWALGDAANIPASKAGSVIHFQMETAYKNILAHIAGKEMEHKFDGHSLCYIESGYGKAVMIDFSYDQEPLHGPDREGSVDVAAAAGTLARGGADVGTHRRDRVRLAGEDVALLEAAFRGEVEVPATVRPDRARLLALDVALEPGCVDRLDEELLGMVEGHEADGPLAGLGLGDGEGSGAGSGLLGGEPPPPSPPSARRQA